MFKKIIIILLFSMVFILDINAIADIEQTIFIDIGNDREVFSGDNVNLVAEIGGTCSNINLSNIYWMEQNDKGDWQTIQSGGTGNINYSFIANATKQVKARIYCPIGIGPIFTSQIIAEDNINITVQEPPTINPTVFAGENATYSSGNIVTLSGSITGTNCTNFDYNWIQVSGPVIEILNASGNIESNIFNGASFIFPNTDQTISLKLNIIPKYCNLSGNIYSGMVNYFGLIIYSGTISSSSSIIPRLTTGFENKKDFNNTGSIKDIDLILNMTKINNNDFINFDWNNIELGGDTHYFLEYSTGSKFNDFMTFETYNKKYDLLEQTLDKNSFNHYFRIKACSLGECSNYSNTMIYKTQDYFKVSCCQAKLVSFEDILSGVDFLLEDYFQVKCIKCRKNNYKDN